MLTDRLANRGAASEPLNRGVVRLPASSRMTSYKRPARAARPDAQSLITPRRRRAPSDEPPIEHPTRLSFLLALLQQELAIPTCGAEPR